MTDETRIFDLYTTDLADEWSDLPLGDTIEFTRDRKDRQLNLRVGSDLLSSLRATATAQNVSYHSLARRLIEEGILRLQSEASIARHSALRPIGTKEATLVLLAAGDRGDAGKVVEGRTRLHKLLFLLTQHLKPDVVARFEAYNFGPFQENLNSDIEFLASEGLIETSGREAIVPRMPSPQRGTSLLRWVEERAGPAQDTVESYRVTKKGLDWVAQFFQDPASGAEDRKTRLVREASRVIEEYGALPLSELLSRVYSEYPEFAKNSIIRDRVLGQQDKR